MAGGVDWAERIDWAEASNSDKSLPEQRSDAASGLTIRAADNRCKFKGLRRRRDDRSGLFLFLAALPAGLAGANDLPAPIWLPGTPRVSRRKEEDGA